MPSTSSNKIILSNMTWCTGQHVHQKIGTVSSRYDTFEDWELTFALCMKLRTNAMKGKVWDTDLSSKKVMRLPTHFPNTRWGLNLCSGVSVENEVKDIDADADASLDVD